MSRFKWSFEKLKEEALKYKTKGEFRSKNPAAYLAATRNDRYEDIVAHMPKYLDSTGENGHNFKWTNEMLQEEALKYTTRGDFQKYSQRAYKVALKRNILNHICSHMNNVRIYWTNEMLQEEALKYITKSDFALNSSSAYVLARTREILDKICSHMQDARNSSKPELIILDQIKQFYPKAQKLIDRKVKIKGRPYARGFEIDIYIPELRKGIEFDGKFHHSLKGLKRGRPNWPVSGLKRYHELKDRWFSTKNIAILHIKEENWKNDRATCISQIEQFLGITGFMSESEPKAA